MVPSFATRLIALAAVCLMLAITGFSQDPRATLTGRVTDANGAAVPAAQVKAKNLKTNEEFTTTTQEEGNYTIPFMLPGNYTVSVEAAGFKKAVNNTIELFVSSKATLDFALEVGQVEQVIEVTGTALLERDTATRGQAVENLRINELPLNAGRNPIMLATLATGVQFNGNPQFFRPFDNGDNVNFSINGGLNRHNEFLLDGAPNNAVTDADADRTRSSNNIAFVPPVDATQEFKVITNPYDSQYGRTGGGVVNIILKSGGNDYHGTAYEFLRRYQLDANDIASNAAGRPRFRTDPVTGENLGGNKLDDFGAMLNGPVRIPGLYDGREKTFFLFNFQGYKQTSPGPRTTSVPTLLERQGNFSQSGITIFDPLTTRANPNFDPTKSVSASNPQFIRDPFPGNIIPTERLDPVGLRILQNFPEPNFGPAGARFNNFLASPNLATDDFYSYVARVDQNFGPNQRMYFRYLHNRRDEFNNGNGLPGLGIDAQDPLFRINDGAVIDSVTTISPTTILNLRGAFSRFVQAADRQRSRPFDAAAFGFAPGFANARPLSIVPRLQFSDGYATFGPRNPNSNITNTLSFQGSLQRIAGRHTYSIGTDIRDIRAYQSGGSFTWGGGQFAFNNNFTRQLPEFADNASGSPIASLLLGAPSDGRVDNIAQLAFRWGYYAFYLQDDFKVSPKLTLNLGFRYDYEGPPTERFNRQNRGFGFEQTSPLSSQIAGRPGVNECLACNNLRGGLLFAGTGDQPRGAFEKDLNNFQPRFGAAYQVAENTVLRGGYGVFYLPAAEYGGSTGFNITTPFVATSGGGANQFIPATRLNNPFPGGLQTPTGASRGLLTQAGTDVIFNLPGRTIPYVQQFSFGLQHELPWAVKLDASYSGSRSNGLLTGDAQIGGVRNINVLSRDIIDRARTDGAFAASLNQSVANPFAGLLPGNLGAATVPRRQLLLPFPQFNAVRMGAENVGKLWYNSFQASAEKRLSAGLVMVASYTLSKNIGALTYLNDQDAAPARALVPDDRTHVLVLSGVYQLPFGQGRRFARDIGRGLDLLIGGWEYTWNGIIQSGTPLNFNGNVDLIGDVNLEDPSHNRWFNNCVIRANGVATRPNAARNGFEPCTDPAFRIRGPNTFRTIPTRASNARNPWAPQFDMALNKSFSISERFRAQVRFESFNTFNTVIRPEPNTDPNSPNFGFVNVGQRNFPRQVQIGLKLVF